MEKVILVILDGWGVSEEITGNAIRNAKTPNMDLLESYYPNTVLQASGNSVGLPWGVMGNSEVGHLTIGGGKIIYQNLPRVTLSIQDGTFFENKAILDSIRHAQENNSSIHLFGLLSSGGVHSHINHLYALLKLIKQQEFPANRVFIHAFTDGRDVDPKSSQYYIVELENNITNEKLPGKIASVMGRYFAMDRNENWDRTKRAYDCMVKGDAPQEDSAHEAVLHSYKEDVTDEFIKPVLVKGQDGNVHTVEDNDSVIFFNIREDRARQITKAFVLDEFHDFDRGGKLNNLKFTTMMEYEKGLPVDVIFPPEEVEMPLGRTLSEAGVRQLRIAETEKYAHVTYFFNGGKEKPFPGEDRMLIPSPKVDSYDQTPKMSAEEITIEVIHAIEESKYDFILVNFANPDMLGHTGNMRAAIEAIECIDSCVGRLYQKALDYGFTILVTADHGNAEEMLNPRTGEILTEHTINPVPFIIARADRKYEYPQKLGQQKSVGGMLSDIAPTILDIMQIPEPQEMTGMSLQGNI